jgi:hypothetical protein
MPVLIPVVVGAAVAGAAVSAGAVVAGGIGAALIATGTSMLVGAMMNSDIVNASAKAMESVPKPAATGGYSIVRDNPASDIRNTVRSGVYPQNTIYGKAFVGGVIPWWWISGNRKQFHHFAQVLAGHQIEGVESFYIGSQKVSVDSDGFVTTAKYTRSGKKLIRFTVFKGDQTALPAELITASNKKLVAGDCATGIAWVYVRWEADYDVFSQVGIPEFRFVVKGKKLYDPRTTLTAYSDNPALAARDYLISNLGLRCLTSEVNDSDVIAAANICDELVTTPSGETQKRYTINGALSCENGLKDNLDLINFAMAGSMVWVQGKWSMQAGAYQTPVATINSDQIISVENLTAYAPRREIFNAVTGTFIAENDLFVEKQFPIVANQDFIDSDGEQIERNINFPMVTDAIVAQRLAKIEIMRARQAITISMICNYSTYDLKPGSHVYLNISRYGFSNKVFYVVQRTLTENGMQYTLRETGPSVWDWTQFEGQEVDPEPNTDLPNPYEVPLVDGLVISSGNDALYTATDGTIISRIKCSWELPENQYIYSGGFVEIQYTTGTDDWTSTRVDGDQTVAYLAPVTDGQTYKIKIRFANNSGQRGEWTELEHFVLGKSAPPPDVSNFTINAGVVTWLPVENTPDLAGYKIRFQYGQNDWWDTATPLHDGIITESPYSFTVLPNGRITILIKAVDTSGNESVNPAVITQDLGDVIVENLLLDFPQHPLWLGTKTNCSVVGGELVATDASAFYNAGNLPMYGIDSELFYRNSQSLPMTYEFSFVATKDSILKINYLFTTDNFTIEYQTPSQTSFYGLDTDLFYGADASLVYDYLEPVPWIGQLNIDNTTEILIRVKTTGGVGIDKLIELTAILDVRDVLIRLDDVVILAGGSRLNLGQTLNAIKNIQMTIQADGNNGISARVIDKDPINGPLIEVINSSGVSVNGLIDATIQAY